MPSTKSKKSKPAKAAQTKQSNTLGNYFSKLPSTSASLPQPKRPASTSKLDSESTSSNVREKQTKDRKDDIPLSDDILDLTMEVDEQTVVHNSMAEDILDLTLVEDNDSMDVLDLTTTSSPSDTVKSLPIHPEEMDIVSLSGLLEISQPNQQAEITPTPVISRAPSPTLRPTISEDDEAVFMKRLMQSMEETVDDSSIASSSSTGTSLASASFSSSRSAISTAPTSRTSSIQSINSSASCSDRNVTSSGPSTTTNDLNMSDFLTGCEDWDLDDIVLTPVKPKRKHMPDDLESPSFSAKAKGKQREVTIADAIDAGLRDALLRFSGEQQRDLAQESCTRCIVDKAENEYDSNMGKWRKALSVTVQEDGESISTAFVYLYDDWYFLEVAEGNTINVIGQFTTPPTGPRHISLTVTSLNLVILHPDILLTATTLASASNCTRRPLLASLLRDTTSTTGRATPALVYGSLLHIVAQKALVANDWSSQSLEKWIEEAVTGSEGLTMLLSMGGETNENVARRDVTERAKGLMGFGTRYMSWNGKGELPPEAIVSDSRSGPWDQPARLKIESVIDIEEEIWSPRWGMKGKIDATVLATLYEPAPLAGAPKSSRMEPQRTTATSRTLPLPLELKTGRPSTGLEHRAQTMLYTLLLGERYGVPVKDGLLLYTQKEDGEVMRVPRGWHEIKGLVGVRNGVASWISKRFKGKEKRQGHDRSGEFSDAMKKEKSGQVEEEAPFLPAPVDQEWLCKKCYVLNSCLLFRRTHPDVEEVGGVSRPKPTPAWLEETHLAKTGHITNARAAFFRKWERLLSLEERDSAQLRTEIWTMNAKKREESGRCLRGMILADDEGGKEDKLTHSIRRFTHTFKRAGKAKDTPSIEIEVDEGLSVPSTPARSSSLLNGAFSVGDPVVISAEPDLLAIAQGYVLDLTVDKIVVGVDHELTDSYATTRLLGRGADIDPSSKRNFRIDKDELSGSMSRVRNNLAQLFYVEGEKRQLELVVDLRAPVFDSDVDNNFRLVSQHASSLDLNSAQQAAMRKVLAAEDYALILGMPGTGKTTVIAAIIHELVKRGKTVLLSSYTHSAVDTILNKVVASAQVDFGILRLGNIDKVHPSMREYTLDARRPARTVEELERQLCSPPVVATTCLSVEHALFTRRKFDYCIVDEASQITLPTCLGPIRFADKFVLVGDHFQLPPLVRNPIARAGGLDISLFKRLCEAHPSAVVDLCYQYRMNEDIMLLSNKLIYNDRLMCGNEEVASSSLCVPYKERVIGRLHQNLQDNTKCQVGGTMCWIEKLMNASSKAVFVDTDLVPALESRESNLPQNLGEASMIQQLVISLVEGGVKPSQIGVLSLYRQQVKLLQHLLDGIKTRDGADTDKVEVMTTDRSQGRDKNCIIISLVRSNADLNTGQLIRDWRRMNVAFTRAKKKLVIFGSRKTLGSESLLGEFFGLMEGKGWIVQPGEGADNVHSSHLKQSLQTPNHCAPIPRSGSSRKRAMEDDSNSHATTPTRGVQAPAFNVATPCSASIPFMESVLDGDSEGGLDKGIRPMKKLRVNPQRTDTDVLRDLNW